MALSVRTNLVAPRVDVKGGPPQTDRQTDSFNWDTNPHTPRLYCKPVGKISIRQSQGVPFILLQDLTVQI